MHLGSRKLAEDIGQKYGKTAAQVALCLGRSTIYLIYFQHLHPKHIGVGTPGMLCGILGKALRENSSRFFWDSLGCGQEYFVSFLCRTSFWGWALRGDVAGFSATFCGLRRPRGYSAGVPGGRCSTVIPCDSRHAKQLNRILCGCGGVAE